MLKFKIFLCLFFLDISFSKKNELSRFENIMLKMSTLEIRLELSLPLKVQMCKFDPHFTGLS